MDFIPSLPVFIAFSVAALLLVLTPGPDMTLFLGRTLSQGKANGMASMMGAVFGIFIHTSLVALGISALIAASPSAFGILRIVGAGYLAWLAFQAIRTGTKFELKSKKEKPASMFSNWVVGIGINLLNPKIVLFFITFLPQFVSITDPHAIGKMLFLGIYFAFICIILGTGMIFLVDRYASALKKNPKVIRIIDYMFAGVFGAFAVKILLTEKA
ncbi:MAG: LysE family translocator [Rhizobiaceae bacterium]|nr:LysE family translocator [Rhizobiaceae bacterium]